MHQIRPIVFAIMASDVCALLFAFGAAYLLRSGLGGFTVYYSYLKWLPLILLFIPLYMAFGLYPGLLLAGPEQLKRMTIATSIGNLFMASMLFMGQLGMFYSRLVLLAFWLFAIFSVPLFRIPARRFFSHFRWWGYPVLFFGKSQLAAYLAKHLRANPELGYRALGAFSEDEPESATAGGIQIEKLPARAAEIERRLLTYQKEYPLTTAVLIMNGLEPARQKKLFKLVNAYFRRIILIPNETYNVRLSVNLSMFCSQISLSMRQNLLDPFRLHMKRFLDLLIIAVFALPTIPIFLLICLLVALDSRGPIFYRHSRIGQYGRSIKVWKFRTMRADADKILNDCMKGNPGFEEEWFNEHKLRNDPRVTRVGRFLRKTSLDELPQLFNVLSGNMSLVGPRPIVEQEIEKYGESFELYKQVKPGITGLWQVSGRNDTGYHTRVTLDETYIANWSVWLDIYILARTLPAAVTATGAY